MKPAEKSRFSIENQKYKVYFQTTLGGATENTIAMKKNMTDPKAGGTTAVDQSATANRTTARVRTALVSIPAGRGAANTTRLTISTTKKMVFEGLWSKLTVVRFS